MYGNLTLNLTLHNISNCCFQIKTPLFSPLIMFQVGRITNLVPNSKIEGASSSHEWSMNQGWCHEIKHQWTSDFYGPYMVYSATFAKRINQM